MENQIVVSSITVSPSVFEGGSGSCRGGRPRSGRRREGPDLPEQQAHLDDGEDPVGP